MADYKCIMCGSADWENVDKYRYKPAGMAMCKSCAFVTYPEKCANISDVHKHYAHEYRTAPTVQNLFSSERKLHYHIVFLEEIFESWKEKSVRVVEIGAALGLFLNWVKQNYPKSEVHGTELTESFVRTAWNIYRIKLDADFDSTKKYDLISSYKVAEHMPDVVAQLARYRSSLTDGGYLYISVPTWFHRMNDFGSTGFHIENYYDPNHVNVWTSKQFEYLLRRSGFKIVKENHTFYDDTYLCQITEPSGESYKEDPTLRLDQLRRIHEASLAMDQMRFKEAIALWPNNPTAQMSYYEQNRNKAHQEGWETIWGEYVKPAWDACGNTHYILVHVCDVLMRYEKYSEALEVCKTWLDNHPMDTQAFMNMAHCLRTQALRTTGEKEKTHLLKQANQLLSVVEKNSLERRYEAMTWMMQNSAMIPTPFEGEAPVKMTATETSNVDTRPT